MNTVSREEFSAALAALEEECIRNRRFRRRIEELLYHLDESNMPNVAERIRALRRDLLTFRLEEGAEEARETSLSASALKMTEKTEDAVYTLTATPRTLSMPALFAEARPLTAGMRPVYINEDGALTAVLV